MGTCDPDNADHVSLIDLAEFGQASSTRCAELEILSVDSETVEFAMPVLTFFGGRSHVDEYEIHSDGTIGLTGEGTWERETAQPEGDTGTWRLTYSTQERAEGPL